MIQCSTLAQAQAVPNVIHVDLGPPIVAYQEGDTLPVRLLPPPDLTAEELDAQEPLLSDLMAQATGAVTGNNTFLAIASPTNAQTLAQVRALTQQNNRILRGLFRVIQRVWRNGHTPP